MKFKRPFYNNGILVSALMMSMVFANTCRGQAVLPDDPEFKRFDTWAKYLSGGTGQWVAQNPNHDPNNPRSAKTFELWFERPMANLMTLKIMASVQDSLRLSSQGIFSWNPSEAKMVHVMSDRGMGFAEGVSMFPSDSVFISTMMEQRPNGHIYMHKDENFVVSENVHRNTSYQKDEKGNWTPRNSWVWTRRPEN